MKRASRAVVCLTILVTLGTLMAVVAGGAQRGADPAALERQPYSGGVLMAQATAAGRAHLASANISPAMAQPAESCSPVPCVLPNVDAAEGGSNAVKEDPIAVNPNNASQWITGGNDRNCASLLGFFGTTDGGSTFHHNCLGTPAGTFGAGEPIVGYDLNGNVYVGGIYSDLPISLNQVMIAKSEDGGVTFPAPHTAVMSSSSLVDKDWMEIDTNPSSPFAETIYISATFFSASNASQIAVSHSTDGGNTFKTAGVGPAASFPETNQFTDLAISKDGTVYVSYINCPGTSPLDDCGGTSTKILVSKSTDGGNTWSTPVVATTVTLAPNTCFDGFYGCLPNTFEPVSEIPVIAVDNGSGTSAGRVYIGFYTWTGTFMSVRVISSTDGGKTWGAQHPVAPSTDTHDQFLPWLNVSSGGLVGVTLLDRRNDASNVRYQAFLALSKDGVSFFNVKLASAGSNPNNAGFGGIMGDYTGNAWNGKTLLVSWMDTRSGTPQDEVGGFTIP